MPTFWEAKAQWQTPSFNGLPERKRLVWSFPDDPHLLGWGENLPYATDLARRLGIAEPLPATTFNFPVGSMFWARTAALRPLLELGLNWDDFPAEPVPYDGSLLHAIERLLPFVVERAGFRSAVTHVAGVTR